MEATSNIVHECKIVTLLVENLKNYEINIQLKPSVMRNSPFINVEDNDHDSDCESVTSDKIIEESKIFSKELCEKDKLYEMVKRRFLSSLGSIGMHTDIMSVKRNRFCSDMGQAKMQSFRVFARAMEKKCGGDGNLKYAWYGGSSDEIRDIVTYGFGVCNGVFKHGVYLSPAKSSIESVKSAIADKDGIQYVLLCHVIMGKMEQIRLGSRQSHPSSVEFDSGVDDLISPNKYIIWGSRMNTHILPEYLISFRTQPCSQVVQGNQATLRLPNSPWMPFRALISELSKFLPQDDVAVIFKYYSDHKKRKISRHELIRQLRKIAGDKLLTSVITSFRNKKVVRRITDLC